MTSAGAQVIRLVGLWKGTEPSEIDHAISLYESGRVESALFRFGRVWAPALLDGWWRGGSVDQAFVGKVLLDVWSAAEFPCRALRRSQWVEWFTFTGFLSDAECLPPGGPIEVWRAQVGRNYGLSWTTSAERAWWFHNRNALFGLPRRRLLRAIIEPCHVLALVSGRNEEEVLVHPGAFRRRPPESVTVFGGGPGRAGSERGG